MTGRHPRPASDAPETGIESAYDWNIATDRIEWQPNAPAVFGVSSTGEIATGRQLANRIAPDHVAQWRAAIADATTSPANQPAAGIPYRVQIKLSPRGETPESAVWLEDTGRWWPAPNGRPARSRGILRIIDERYLENLRLEHADDDASQEQNRTRLLEALGAIVGRAERTQSSSALFLVSLNALDAVNAELGSDIGDELISATGRLLKSALQDGETIGRLASNVFTVIVDNCRTVAMGETASRLIEHVHSATLQTTVGPLSATVSVGGIAVPGQASTGTEAIGYALAALERAKRKGGGAFVAHDADTAAKRKLKREQAVTNSVMAAIEEDRMLLVLQPIVWAASGKPAFFEALLRLRRRDGTVLPASEFIEDAERLGLARLIDRRALELAITLMTEHPTLELSINVSSLTAGNKDWIAALRTLTSGNPGLLSRLTVEITETAMIHDIEEVAAFVEVLRTLGCKTAIDDFGAGYTSFRHLKTLHVDMLKIDGIFVKNLPSDHQGRTLIKTMIDIAHAFGLETVAEWVSDEADAEFLRQAGVTYLQGFLYGAPMAIDELIQKGLFVDQPPPVGAT